MDTLFDAWSGWLAGRHVGDLTLWGMTVSGWGRAGMIMEFVAAWIILADILGPDRIRAYGRSIRTQFSRASPGEVLAGTVEWAKAFVAWLRAPSGSAEELKNRLETERYAADKLNILMAFVLTLAVGWFLLASLDLSGFTSNLIVFGIAVVVGLFGLMLTFALLFIFVAPLTTMVILGAIALVSMFVSGPILVFAAVLDHPNNERALKIASFVLLAVGFQFDLLSA